jgi:hypothetical protein
VLHQVAIDQAVELSRRTLLASGASLSVGEVDYTTGGAVVSQSGATTVQTSVSKLFRMHGQSALKHQLTRRASFNMEASAEYLTPLDERTRTIPVADPNNPGQTQLITIQGGSIPSSAQVMARPNLGYILNREDRLTLNTELTYQWFSDSGKYLLLSPDISWERRVNKRTGFGLSAGLAYVVAVDVPPDIDSGGNLGGTGSFGIGSEIYRTRDVVASLNAHASLEWYFDPIAGTSQPRAGTGVGSSISVGRHWRFTPNLSFYTLLRGPATRSLVDPTTGMALPPEVVINTNATTLRADFPARYEFSRYASFNFGLRTALRGREIKAADFSLTEQYEFWAYAGFTLRLPSGHDDGTWLSL